VITPEAALTEILAQVTPLGAESVSLSGAVGRIAASSASAKLSLPSFDLSAMDGYAIHAADCGKTGTLEVIGEQPAGKYRALELAAGQAIRIFTGAPIPVGTGAVVMQEDTQREGNRVTLLEPAESGEFIRRKGADLCEGQLLWSAGTRLSAAKVSLAASQGQAEISVGKRPRVGILTTGSELQTPGIPLAFPGQIYNSNATLLQGLLQEQQVADAIVLDAAADDFELLQACIKQLLETCEVVLIAGGVSVGDHDLVKPALAALGLQPEFWRVAVKPGKPFLYARSQQRGEHPRHVFGLPGNPVSAYVTSVLFVLPALRKLAGSAMVKPPRVSVRLLETINNTDRRETYFRGWVDAAAGTFQPLGLQESHALFGLSRSNALLPVPPLTIAPSDSMQSALMLTT
jgi:molybdopterin molybdotransferase